MILYKIITCRWTTAIAGNQLFSWSNNCKIKKSNMGGNTKRYSYNVVRIDSMVGRQYQLNL